ncbi:MAG TPA: hypothetical protein VLE53_07725 [Gemmatimonadaceae bacterium]|nr:hypothetical protein [Gemmatimonadaceae bacterium]
MAHGALPTLFGFTGVALLLAAFILNLRRVLPADGVTYLVLNAVGAGLAAWSSWLIDFVPFVILEGTWAAAAVVGLVRALNRTRRFGGTDHS